MTFRISPRFKPVGALLGALALALWGAGCAARRPLLTLEGLGGPIKADTIWDTVLDQDVSFAQLIDSVRQAKVLYIGERHTDPVHHHIQLQIIKALVEQGLAVRVGMEMFDKTYQDKLDRWTAGEYDYPTFLREVHWYANWRYDDDLYRDILMYVQAQKIKLVGLNIPFWLPPKIAVGGLESLSEQDRAYLPAYIDTSNAEHRAYLEKIFNLHRAKGQDNFEFFYEAQCAWEDGMAQAVADNLSDGILVVLVGNGHIQGKYGIPDRAKARRPASFKTIYLATAGDAVNRRTADFIWATTSPPISHP
jgi:uncharacterized iron-regulated protein